MFSWISENLITVGICAVIAALLVLAVISIVKNRKKGKTCSCGCEGCVYSGICSGQSDKCAK